MLVLDADRVGHLEGDQSLCMLREELLLSCMPPVEGLLSLLPGQCPLRLLPRLVHAWLYREEVSNGVAKYNLGWGESCVSVWGY